MGKISFEIRNWLEHADFEELKRQVNGRTVWLLEGLPEEKIIPFLGEKGFETAGVIKLEEPDKLAFLKAYDPKTQFLFISHHGAVPGLVAALSDHGMREGRDFSCIMQSKELSSLAGYYRDECGNEIISEDYMGNVRVFMEGYHNRLYIGAGFSVYGDAPVDIRLKGNADVNIGRGTAMKSGIMFFRDSVNEIGKNSYLASNVYISNFGGRMKIGEEFEALDSLYICVAENAELTIGKGCMAAKNVKILSGAAHSLFDLTLKKNISMEDNTHVTIGEHVWLGMGSSVLYNTEIGAHSMLGADSVAKGNYPAHAVMAGSIARVIRENTDWDREDYMTYEEFKDARP